MNKSFWIILFLLTITIETLAQQPVSETTINLRINNKPLKEVFEQISSETGLFFAYNPKSIDDTRKTSVIVHNRPLKEVLDNLASEFGFTYSIIEKQIILKPVPAAETQSNSGTKVLLSGYVVDNSSKEVLIGALIYVDGQFRTFTNEYGFFSLNLPAGNHLIAIDFVGYRKYINRIDLKKDTTVTISLNYDPKRIETVVVTPEENSSLVEQNPLDRVNYSRTVMQRSPGLAGSYDAMKSLQAIPGFNFYGDGSVIFHVRGGDKSQNLILVDDAPVFNTSHLLGFFSIVSPSAVNNINVYKNDLPVQYWGRGSSVIDIRIREGDYQNTGFTAETGPFLSSLTLDGPVKKGRSSYLVSFRTSNLNWLYSGNLIFMKVKFYDFHLKFNYRKDKKNKLSFSLFSGQDQTSIERDYYARSMWWGNIAFAARWNHIFSGKMFSNTTFYTGRYSYFLAFEVDSANIFNSMLYQTGLKTDFSYFIDSSHRLKFGYGVSHLYFNPANINELAYVPTSNALEGVLYGGYTFSPSDKVKINIGSNLHLWLNTGPTVIYRYNNYLLTSTDTVGFEIYNYFLSSEPRGSITYSPDNKTVFKLSAGYYTQYLQLVSNSISPFTTVEAWMSSDNNIAPQKTAQVSAGVFRKLGVAEISGEIYAKRSNNLVFMIDHSSLLFNPYLISNVRQGSIASAGAEFFIRKNKGKLNYWLSFTYSRTLQNIPALTGNYWFWASYDKPVNINMNLSYKEPRWNASISWVYSSGTRYTAPVGYYEFLDHKIPVYSYPYNEKMPDYHRLDMSFTYRLNKIKNNKVRHYLTLSVYNIYGRKNPVLVSFNKIEGPDGSFYVPGNYIYQYELTPAYYYLLRYVPSLTYRISLR